MAIDKDFLTRQVTPPWISRTQPLSLPTFIDSKGVSSIDKVSPKFIPVLDAPKTAMMLQIYDALQGEDKLIQKSSEIFKKDAEHNQKTIEDLRHQIDELFLEEIKAAKNKDNWGALATVVQYVGSISAIAIGFASGTWPGILMAVGGIAGGTVRVMNDTQTMQGAIAWFTKSKELQEKIQHDINTGAVCLQVALSFTSGAAAISKVGATASIQALNNLETLQALATRINQANALLNGASFIGKTNSEKKVLELSAATKKLDVEIFTLKQDQVEEAKKQSEILENQEMLVKNSINLIKKQEVEEVGI